MGKVQVSRAAAKLLDAGHNRKEVHPEDKPRATLSLSDSGLDVYNQIAPNALEREAHLSSALTGKEKETLIQLLDKLTRMARSMTTTRPTRVFAHQDFRTDIFHTRFIATTIAA